MYQTSKRTKILGVPTRLICIWQLGSPLNILPRLQYLKIRKMGQPFSTKLYNCLLLRREFCRIPQSFYFETIIRLSLGFLMVGAFEKNATGEWGMRLRPVADETILNKQPRGFQGATDSLKKKSLLRAYKLWNQSAPSVHKPTERNTTNVYTRHEDFYAKPITTISA